MTNFPWLSVVTFLPLLGVFFILLIRGDVETVARNARSGALWTSLITFAVSLGLWINFDNSTADFQFVEKVEWMPGLGLTYHLGIDGISMFFIILATLLTVLCIAASWVSITERVKEFMIAFLVLETLMVGMFSSLDLILFYVFFEGVLIPMFIIIGVWGGPRRNYAAFKFFLFTLAGSVLMLLAILTMIFEAGTADMTVLLTHDFPLGLQPWLWLAFFASFAVKMPMWPVHTWLPDAHVEAPTAGSVILAGVLLKFGGYGFLRFSLPMFPIASADFTPLIFTLSVIAIIYTSLVALAQEDMKKLIAYSSVAHMGFVTMGAFAANIQAVEGAIVQMLSHGVVSAALFLIVGVVYDRIHSREIADYGGLVHRMPSYALVFMVFMLASVGLPGTSGFVGEFLVLTGTFQVNAWVALLAATGVILGAVYMLYLYRRVIFGQLTKESLAAIRDMNGREIAVFAPLLLIVFIMGIYPEPFLAVMHVSVENLIERYESALAAAQGAASVAAK
ncbi:MAG: NADH-quinone oxidoreductase subunit M [Rhodospirillaceae bacterium]|nr:NADH-quinone oxidoreductase subunit M [Rhodospirillaceae bacterium]